MRRLKDMDRISDAEYCNLVCAGLIILAVMVVIIVKVKG